MDSRGTVFVVAGPSGAGKDTLIKRALQVVPRARLSISATTRAPREGEEHGRDYHFLTEDEFDRLVGEGAFLEWARVFSGRYGTLSSDVEKMRDEGIDVILEIDVQGALQVKDKLPDARFVFIMPSSLEVLEERLRRRGLDSEPEIGKRLGIAPKEIEIGKREFDVIIVNDELEKATEELVSVLKGEGV
ncbi:MAG: guanylate kinase [Actinobacteria bacterium]|nr:guanylate kinase [Actinomycetota bacterium]MBU1942209.1 guanylate kinase [Actinomycetota bacterium]MBU2687442.1 guanylate kinase [Actinomycetota bacterium]